MRVQIKHFALRFQKVQFVSIPAGAKIISLQVMQGIPYIIAEVDLLRPHVSRAILMYKTGEQIGEKAAAYIGTIKFQENFWHFYDSGRLPKPD